MNGAHIAWAFIDFICPAHTFIKIPLYIFHTVYSIFPFFYWFCVTIKNLRNWMVCNVGKSNDYFEFKEEEIFFIKF